MEKPFLKSIILASCLLTGALSQQNKENTEALEQMIEISPYKNIPQNKNIQNTLNINSLWIPKRMEKHSL